MSTLSWGSSYRNGALYAALLGCLLCSACSKKEDPETRALPVPIPMAGEQPGAQPQATADPLAPPPAAPAQPAAPGSPVRPGSPAGQTAKKTDAGAAPGTDAGATAATDAGATATDAGGTTAPADAGASLTQKAECLRKCVELVTKCGLNQEVGCYDKGENCRKDCPQ